MLILLDITLDVNDAYWTTSVGISYTVLLTVLDEVVLVVGHAIILLNLIHRVDPLRGALYDGISYSLFH